jgi:hypothetical protein
MFLLNILHVAQPIIGQAHPLTPHHGLNTTAAIMTDDHDVLYFEYIDGELDDREAIKIRVHHHVRQIAMHEDFARQQADDLISRNA